jgi:hypothetical protein
MLIDEYLYLIVVKDRLREARQRAATDRLLQLTRRERTPNGTRSLLRRVQTAIAHVLKRPFGAPPRRLAGWR